MSKVINNNINTYIRSSIVTRYLEVNPRNRELIGNCDHNEFSNIFLLIALTTVFVGSEFALVKVRSSRIDQLASEGNGSARVVKND